MTDVENTLRRAFRQHELHVVVGERFLESAIDRATWRRRRRVALALGVAIVVVSGVVVAAQTDHPTDSDLVTAGTIVGPVEPAILDLGSLDRLPSGSRDVLDEQGVFVLRTTDGEVTAFSQRAPKEGCRLVLATSLPEGFLGPEAVFHDPCGGATFDRDGRKLGGPGIRGMYRYDVAVMGRRIHVDTGLAHPGPYTAGVEGADMSTDRVGTTDGIATRWREAMERAGAVVRGEDSGSLVWVLGSFHDSTTRIVSVPFTIDGFPGELQIGPPELLEQPAITDAQQFDLDAGRLVISTPTEGTVLYASLALSTGQQLRAGLLLPTGAGPPEIEDLVALFDQTVTVALG